MLDYLSTLHNSRCNSSVVVQVSALSLVLSILAVLYNGLWQNNLYNLEILQQTINFHYLATQPADQHQPPGQCPGNKLIADPTPRPSRQPHTTMLWLIISELFIPWWSEVRVSDHLQCVLQIMSQSPLYLQECLHIDTRRWRLSQYQNYLTFKTYTRMWYWWLSWQEDFVRLMKKLKNPK